MNKYIIPIIIVIISLLALYFFPWRNINWGKITMDYPKNITVQGYAETDKNNQVASFSAGVTALNDDRQIAIDEVNTKISELTKKISEFGIEDKDIQTQSISVFQEERFDQNTQRSTKGQWRVNNQVEVKLRNLDRVNEFTDLLSSSGADNVYGPNFTVDSSMAAGDDLLGKAVENARSKAESLAQTSGLNLGRIISIQEGGSSSPVVGPFARMEGLGGGGADLKPGSTTVSKTVTVMFEVY